MKKLFLVLLNLVFIVALTVLTQVGGLLYLLFLIIARWIPWSQRQLTKHLQRTGFFLSFYLLVSILLMPLLSDRSPLPWRGNIRPATYWTCLLNRHYVEAEVVQVLDNIQEKLAQDFPDIQVVYLDGNFPFWDGFPLIPHLSHDDGEKLDLTFIYERDGQIQPIAPGRVLGYGRGELPGSEELDQSDLCENRGYWFYDRVDWASPNWLESNAIVNVAATSALITYLAQENSVEKIFLEPHLQKRWRVDTYPKVRFQGCHSVKHDDHIHFQIR